MGFKHDFGKMDNFPGPGAYTANFASVRETAPSFSLASRYLIKDTEITPGPAAYTPNRKHVSKSAPSITLSSRYNEGKPDILPGPG